METTQSLLIIDDSETDREIYRRYLQQAAQPLYTISEAECAQIKVTLPKRLDAQKTEM